jgi:hypothetical protein
MLNLPVEAPPCLGQAWRVAWAVLARGGIHARSGAGHRAAPMSDAGCGVIDRI